ncbi:MAG: hypothetical protein AAFQ66_10155 [Pseudomonadota bacterium]
MRIFLILSFSAALAFIVIAGSSYGRAVGLDEDRYCLRSLYVAARPDAEIIFIGSSRIRRGVEPDILTDALNLPQGAVVNLAHPTVSLPLDYATIRDVTNRADPKVVVFGVVPTGPDLHAAERAIDPRPSAPFDLALSSGKVKQRYVLASSFRDQIRRAYSSADSIILGSWDAARLVANRMQNFVPAVLRGDILRALIPTKGNAYYPRDYDCMVKAWNDPDDKAQHGRPQHRERREGYLAFFGSLAEPAWEDPTPLGFLDAPERSFERSVIHDLVALGKDRNFTPVFYYMPGINVPIDPRLPEAFEAEFGAPLLVLHNDLRVQLADGHYFDNVHLNTKGRERVTPWLATALGPFLERTSP